MVELVLASGDELAVIFADCVLDGLHVELLVDEEPVRKRRAHE